MVTRMDSVYNYVLCDCVLRKCRYTCGVWALRGLSAVTCVRRGGGEKTPAKPASRPAAARALRSAGFVAGTTWASSTRPARHRHRGC